MQLKLEELEEAAWLKHVCKDNVLFYFLWTFQELSLSSYRLIFLVLSEVEGDGLDETNLTFKSVLNKASSVFTSERFEIQSENEFVIKMKLKKTLNSS